MGRKKRGEWMGRKKRGEWMGGKAKYFLFLP